MGLEAGLDFTRELALYKVVWYLQQVLKRHWAKLGTPASSQSIGVPITVKGQTLTYII